jgi:predicted TIM-barrel fold metal-dependent hydrolase
MRADDPEILPYFALAEELDLPLGIHMFPGGPNGGLYLMPQLAGMRAANANPMQLEAALIAHPGARVYVMHGGWPYLEDMKALMYAHPQVYVDTSVIDWILPESELHAFLESLIDAGFGDRIMFGSDQMVWPQTIGIGIRSIDSAPFLSPEQKEDIFYNNAARFLRLTPQEISLHKSGSGVRK